jgi:F0F1-type ATP synthase membrane subunit a
MKLSEFKEHLRDLNQVDFISPTGEMIPTCFIIKEIDLIAKYFSNSVRTEANMLVFLN